MTSKLASLSTIGGNDPFSLVLGKKVEKPVEKKEHKKPSLKPGFFMDDKGRLGFDPEKKLVHESVRELRGMAAKHGISIQELMECVEQQKLDPEIILHVEKTAHGHLKCVVLKDNSADAGFLNLSEEQIEKNRKHAVEMILDGRANEVVEKYSGCLGSDFGFFSYLTVTKVGSSLRLRCSFEKHISILVPAELSEKLKTFFMIYADKWVMYNPHFKINQAYPTTTPTPKIVTSSLDNGLRNGFGKHEADDTTAHQHNSFDMSMKERWDAYLTRAARVEQISSFDPHRNDTITLTAHNHLSTKHHLPLNNNGNLK